MPISTVSLAYRPVRIGFLIKDGNEADFIKCCKINTLLWGGLLNPIIPVTQDLKSAQILIDAFGVDILLSVSSDPQIDTLITNNPHLNPARISKDIFYEDWRTKKQLISYVDILHLIEYYWDVEIKHSKEDVSTCRHLTWEENDLLAKYFTVMFGKFPTEFNLKHPYEQAFKKGLRAKEIKINGNLDKDIVNGIYPITFTKSRLSIYREWGGSDGIFIGDSQNLSDLIVFWNLRATGRNVVFVPQNEFDRARDFVQAFVEGIDKLPSSHPEYEDWIHIYSSTRNNEKAVKEIISQLTHQKKFVYAFLYDTHSNYYHFPITERSETEFKSVSAFIEKDDDCFSVAVPLPEVDLFSKENIYNQEYVILCRFGGDFGHPGHTLMLPFFPDLNEFYGRHILIHPHQLRIQSDGTIALLEHMNVSSLKFYPVPISDLMARIFNRADIHNECSQPGRLANLIINRMGGIDSCRVFKIRGVRRLLKEKGAFSWVDARKIIVEENFQKFKDLYIESRTKKNLTNDDVLHHLLKKNVFKIVPTWSYAVFSKIFRKQKEFACVNCGHKSWISVIDFQNFWGCPYCTHKHYLPLFMNRELIDNRKEWLVKKSGLFSKEDNQEGSIPVLLTLMQLNILIGRMEQNKWCASLNLKVNNIACEIDFAFLDLGPRMDGQDLSIAIGECKEKDEITDEDIKNLCLVKEALDASGIKCFLVFSKTTDGFSNDEIKRFKNLIKEKRIKPILFSNEELEPYEPYWFHHKEGSLPYKYAHNFSEIAENSQYIYLSSAE